MTFRDPWGYAGKTYDDAEMRMLVAALSSGRGGVASTTDLAVSAQASPGPTVRVAAGYAVIPATASGERGGYATENDASVNTAAITATGGLPRWDLIILRSVSGVIGPEVVQGTANASPSEPSLAAKDNYIRLARIEIPASTTNITNAMIVDQRPVLESPHACTSTTRPAAPFDGQEVYETDTDLKRIWDGTLWARTQRPLIVTSATRPTSTERFTGQTIWETDTKTLRAWDGSNWILLSPEAWTDISSFLNSWVNYATGTHVRARVRLLDHRNVRLEGAIKSGTIGSPAFQLAAGYRPTKIVVVGATDFVNAYARVDIDTSGNVTPATGDNRFIGFCTTFGID